MELSTRGIELLLDELVGPSCSSFLSAAKDTDFFMPFPAALLKLEADAKLERLFNLEAAPPEDGLEEEAPVLVLADSVGGVEGDVKESTPPLGGLEDKLFPSATSISALGGAMVIDRMYL